MYKPKILIVDDSSTIRKIIKANLARLDITDVYEASNAEDGLNIIYKLYIDIVFVDHIMPGHQTGLDLTKKLQADGKLGDIKLVAISSQFDDQLISEFKMAGAFDFIEKPFDLKRFNEVVGSLFKDTGKGGNGKIGTELLERLSCIKPTIAFDDNKIQFIFGNDMLVVDKEQFISIVSHCTDIDSSAVNIDNLEAKELCAI